jgi:hypothetical protein
MNYIRKATALTRDQAHAMWLAVRREEEARLAVQWRGHLRAVYNPIRLADGSYWRNSKWNVPPRKPRPPVIPPESNPMDMEIC